MLYMVLCYATFKVFSLRVSVLVSTVFRLIVSGLPQWVMLTVFCLIVSL